MIDLLSEIEEAMVQKLASSSITCFETRITQDDDLDTIDKTPAVNIAVTEGAFASVGQGFKNTIDIVVTVVVKHASGRDKEVRRVIYPIMQGVWMLFNGRSLTIKRDTNVVEKVDCKPLLPVKWQKIAETKTGMAFATRYSTSAEFTVVSDEVEVDLTGIDTTFLFEPGDVPVVIGKVNL